MLVFAKACHTGSVSAAADICHLSQPAATQAIAGLENDLGAKLFARKSRELLPTGCGLLFLPRVEAALHHLAEGARNATRGKEARRGQTTFDRQVTAAQLRAFVAIAEAGSFTMAARALGLSQPSVHRAARNLEALASVPFFRSTAVGVELTAPAQSFLLGVKLAQAEIRQGIEEIGKELGEDRGTFHLGSLPLARTWIVPHAVDALVSAHRKVQVRVVDGRYAELLRSLREGDLDCLIGALRDPSPADDVTQEPLFDDALAIVAHPSHPLASKPVVSVDDTLAFPWVAPPKTTPAGQYLYDTLRIHERAVTPVRAVSSSLIMLRSLLALGPYITIISRHQVSVELKEGHMVALPVPLTGNSRAIGLTYRTNWRPTKTQAEFMGYLRNFSAERES